VTGNEYKNSIVEPGNTFSWIIPPNEVPGANWYHMADDILFGGILVSDMINLFIFIGNWDILTLLIIGDIMYFMLVTSCRVNVMYGVMFVLVADLVVCIYVMYL